MSPVCSINTPLQRESDSSNLSSGEGLVRTVWAPFYDSVIVWLRSCRLAARCTGYWLLSCRWRLALCGAILSRRLLRDDCVYRLLSCCRAKALLLVVILFVGVFRYQRGDVFLTEFRLAHRCVLSWWLATAMLLTLPCYCSKTTHCDAVSLRFW